MTRRRRVPVPVSYRVRRAFLRAGAAVERLLGRQTVRTCFEAGCDRPGTHRIRVTVRAERGERIDIMARVVVPAVLCSEHATPDGLSADTVMPRDHRRSIQRDLESRLGCPIDWDRSVVEVRHRMLAWLTWSGA